jgi:RHS repeat-associated protein
MPGRKYTNGSAYRYGFNGKENDKDAGEGIQDYGMRIYGERLGRFLSVNPLTKSYPWYTPYSFAGNKPINSIDIDGLEEGNVNDPLKGLFDGNANQYNIRKSPAAIYIKVLWRSFRSMWKSEDGLGTLEPRDNAPSPRDMINDVKNDVKTVASGDANGIADVAGRWTIPFILFKAQTSSKVPGGVLKEEAPVISQPETQATTANINRTSVEVNNGNAQAANSNSANRGRGTVLEKQNKSVAQQYENSAEGAASDVVSGKRVVPILRYDNPNPNGPNYIKFDSPSFGGLNFVESKINVVGYPKSILQIQRAAEALSQNPGATLVYRVPQNKVNAMNNLIRKAGQAMNTSITVQAAPVAPIK